MSESLEIRNFSIDFTERGISMLTYACETEIDGDQAEDVAFVRRLYHALGDWLMVQQGRADSATTPQESFGR